jgi:formylglycine-generating enzyme required for sulfatase activity
VYAHLEGANPYGCLDMAGNAWEWCLDWYEKHPQSHTRGEWHAWLGGSWVLFREPSFRCAYNYSHVTAHHPGANHSYDDFGFRLAASVS